MKIKLNICILCLLFALKNAAQGPCSTINPALITLDAFPLRSSYCIGSTVSFSVNTPYPLPVGLLNWSFSGTAGLIVTNPNLYKISGVLTSGVVTVNGFVFVGGVNCPFTRTFNLNVGASNNLTADAGPDQIYAGIPVSIGAPPDCASGGTSPYTYDWSPNSGFTSGTNNTQCSAIVAPSSTTTYDLTVTDASGCTATANMVVQNISSSPKYIVPKKTVDAGYQVPISGVVYFMFEEEYRTATLNYQIIDYNTSSVNIPAPLISCPPTSSLKNLGDNRYSINTTGCGLVTSRYYLVEITNDKNEKFYFKFLN